MIRELLESGSPIQIITTIIAFMLIVAALLSLFFIIIGGITFILSAGQEDKIKKAVHTIRYSIVGLIVCFVAFFAVQWIAKLLDIPFDLTFSSIVDLMNEIFASLQ
jgi:uncharacterized membrane protein